MQTLYNDYTDYLMDMRVLCSVLAEPIVPYEELKQSYFKEFAEFKPRPTLEAKRYEVSRRVSDDYKIEYEKQVELRANEKLIDLERSESTKHLVSINDVESIAPAVKEVFLYEHSITDMIREEIMSKYNLTTGEEFTLDVETVENLQGNAEEDKSLWLSEEEVEDIDSYNPSSYAEKEVEYIPDTGVSDEYDYTEEEDTDEEYLDDEEVSYVEEEEDYSDEDYSDEDDYDDYGDYDEEPELDEEVSDFEEEEDEYSDLDEEEDEYSEEVYEEEDDDYSDYTEEEDDNEYDSYDTEEETEEVEEEASKEVTEPEPFIPDLSDIDDDIDLAFENETPVEKPQENLTPVVTNNTQGYVLKPDAHKEVEKPKEEEPTDLRQFIKKHPRCDYNFALQYFTKKQINDAIKIGKIVKRGNILKL